MFSDEYMPNAIAMYNFWLKHRQILVDPYWPLHSKLDAIDCEQFLALNDA